jgi:peptidyl-prolyl cis-trans isomerase A (cyclophilin A)
MQTLSRRDLLALAAALAASPAAAQTAAQTAAQAASPPAVVNVALATPLGRIVLALETAKAPITTANFLKYVDRKLFDGASFYRGSRPEGSQMDNFGFVQGGLQNDPKKVLPPIAHESTLVTGLSHTDGTISMTRYAPGTAQAEFVICLGDQTFLDADAKNPANPGFAAFGHVAEGLEVVKQILVQPKDPAKGEGPMKGEILARPVPILTARRA